MSNVTDEQKKPKASVGAFRTRISASWTAVVVAVLVLILLVIFIAQNTQRSSVKFLGLHGTAPTAVVLLIAATAGALIVVIVGVSRILQLRRAAHSESSHTEPSHPES